MTGFPRLHRGGPVNQTSGIVHLGLGAFFRAFGCPLIARAAARSGESWGVVGVSLRSPDTRDALRPQGWVYTSMSMNMDGPKCTIVDVLTDALVAPEDPAAVLAAMSQPDVKLITLTVTEKGYCHHPSTGQLNREHPDVVHDLVSEMPKSSVGYLVRALQARRRDDRKPFTIVSCDNLPENGSLLRGLVLEMAELIDPGLARWIETEARFPSTMVDRITPATTDADIARVAELTGFHDAAPVVHEPYAQWVIEDSFVEAHRPNFEAAGVQIVSDVGPYEAMKLRMLNGTHSALAYTGYLAGHETISDTVADSVFADFARSLWREIVPAVDAPNGVDLSAYAAALLERYANPNIRHRTWQIAMDGSQKLPQRLLGTLADNLAAGRSSPALCFAVAAWMKYVAGTDDAGDAIDVRDPLAQRMRQLTDASDTAEERVDALLAMTEIFPAELVPQLRESVTAAAKLIAELGVRAGIEHTLHFSADGRDNAS